MLIGEYISQVTFGNRSALPKKFRLLLGKNLILSRGYEGCLLLVSQEQWQIMLKDVAQGPFVSTAIRDSSRFLLGGAHEVNPDAQGRIVLPESLRRYAKIKEQVVFLGLGRWVEVWDEGKWREREEYLSTESSRIAESLAMLRLDE